MFWGIIISILSFYGILIIVNIPAPFLGLEFESNSKPKLRYAPQGYLIPLVWFFLFTLLGIARYNLVYTQQEQAQWWLYGLAFLCATYAYYTLGLAKLTNISALWFGLIGNTIVILYALFVVWKLYSHSSTAAILTAPVVLWTVYANLIVLGEMRLAKLI